MLPLSTRDANPSVGHQMGAAFCLQRLFCLRLTMRNKKATRRRGVEGKPSPTPSSTDRGLLGGKVPLRVALQTLS